MLTEHTCFTMDASSPAKSTQPFIIPAHTQPLLIVDHGDGNQPLLAMVRKRPSLSTFFIRSSTRTSSDASTPSASRSHSPSRSPSTTSSYLIDDDPFAKLSSPISPSRNDFSIIDPPSPSTSATEFLHSDNPPRSPLAKLDPPRPIIAQRSKAVRNTPSLPSLSELAHAGGSSYASAFAHNSSNAASKRFPLEPWDLIDGGAESDDYGDLSSTSRVSTLRGPRPPLSQHPSPITESPESRRASIPIAHPDHVPPDLERVTHPQHPSPISESSESPELYPSHESGSRHEVGPSEQSSTDLFDELPCITDDVSLWDIVHDAKDAMQSEDDAEDEAPGPACARKGTSRSGPVINEAAGLQGQGQGRNMMRRGGAAGSDDTAGSDYGSDGDGSDAGTGGSGENGRGHGDDEDGDHNRARSAFSDDDDEDDDEDDRDSVSDEDSEDNVPLAQRIPGALQAQKSIRIKDRAARQAQKQRQRPRPRVKAQAQTLLQPQTQPRPIAVDDLTQRLLKVRAAEPLASASQQHARPRATSSQQPRSSSEQRTSPQQHASEQHASPQQRASGQHASPQRHASSSQHTSSQQPPAPVALRRPAVPGLPGPQPRHVSLDTQRNAPQEASSALLSRQPTVASSSRNQSAPRPFPPADPPSALTSQPLARSATSHHRRPSASQPQSRFLPQDLLAPQTDTGLRTSHELQAYPDTASRRSHESSEEHSGGGTAARARTLSAVTPPQRVLQRSRTSGPQPVPMPPVPIPRQGRDGIATQHRVFVGDMQCFNTVDIGPHTNARDVLELVEAQGELRGEAARAPGGWMLWELAQDFGMERPLREYELPAEVCASWNSNTRLNAFMIKKTLLAPLLARKAMPSSSPRCSGYVQWESKRGKWNKRWMELREHSIWLSKRDNGKDETFLCSLSNFDCYYVLRLHKAPKSFVFALKSTESLTLFENPADYLHVFSCDQKEGQKWMEHILLARSYVLYKERTVLFGASTLPTSSAPIPNQVRSRSPNPPRPAAPLVDVNALQTPAGSTATKVPFQSGSLLAKTAR